MEGIKEIVFKKQKKSKDVNGVVEARDSWIIYYTDPDRVPEIVFEDPAIEKLIDISMVDIYTLKPQQIAELKTLLGIK